MTDRTRQYVTRSSLTAFVLGLFSHKWLTSALIVVSLILAVLWLRSRTPLYEIDLVVSPAETMGRDSGQRGRGAISSILKLGKQKSDTETSRLFYLITSERLVKHLHDEIDLVEELFGASGAKPQESWFRNLLRSATGQPEPQMATADDAAGWLQHRIRVREIQDTDLTELTLLHENPEQGKRLLLTLYNGADNILRGEALVLSRDRVKYLKALLSEVNVSEYRETLLSLLMEQDKKVMLLQDGSAYAAKILDGPRVSSVPAYPNYSLTFIIAPLIAVVATIIIVVLGGWIRDLREAPQKGKP